METTRNTDKYGISLMLMLLVIIIAGITVLNKKTQIDLLSRQNVNLNETLELRDSLVNEMANTFDEIEQNLAFIKNKHGQLTITRQEGFENQKEVLFANIKIINDMLEESSNKIDELDKKLNDSGIEIKSFKNKIARLNQLVAEQDNSIKMLQVKIEQRDFKINKMDAQIRSLQNDVASKEDSIVIKSKIIADISETIAENENEINKAFMAIGTYSELVDNGVLTKTGGFLGIGKNKAIRDNLNENYFKQVDIRKTNQVLINSKKVKLISEHPVNSYSLIEENDKIAYLEIENPKEFWKLTKYAIVETR